MSTDPAAAAAFRVPRSDIDSLFIHGEQMPETRVSTGVVVSVDSANTCTVLINDEEITGVLWLGLYPPTVGEVVAVEMRGDLLCVSAINDIDTFREGIDESVAHIVSDANPGLPPAVDLQLGGSMRSVDAWSFYDSRTNLVTNPSFETDTTGWSPIRATLTRTASATAKAGGYVGRVVNDGSANTHYLLTGTAQRISGTAGQVITFSAYARLVTGSGVGYRAGAFFYDAGGAVVGPVQYGTPGDLPIDGSWIRLSFTAPIPAGAVSVGHIIGTGSAVSTDTWEVDALLAEWSSTVGAYIEGAGYGSPATNWIRELSSSGQGLRCYEAGPSVFMARNLVGNPSAEAGLGPDQYGNTWQAATSPGYAGLAAVSVSADTAYSGNVSVLAQWQAGPTGDGVELRVIGLTPGQHTVSAWVYVPAGSPDVQLETTLNGSASSGFLPLKDGWYQLSLLVTITGTSTVLTIATAKATALTGGRVYVDAVMVAPSPPTVPPNYFDGDTVDTLTEQYVWLGTPGLSRSEWWHGAALPSAVMNTNLIPNPSFETNTTGWAPFSVTFARTASAAAKSGANVLRVTSPADGSTDHHIQTTPRLVVDAGRITTFSAWVRLVSGTGLGYTVRCQYFDAAVAPIGAPVSGSPVDLPADGSWVRISVTSTAPALATALHWAVNSTEASSAEVWEVDALLAEVSPNVNPFFDGDTPTVPGSAYQWTGTAHASTSIRMTGPVVPQVTSIYGTLWSEMTFDVEPGDVVAFEMDLTELYHDTTAQVYALYGPVEGAAPLPTDSDTTAAAQGSAVALTASLTTLAASITVPATVAFPISGVAQPRTVRLGVRLAGGGDSQVLALAARGTHTPMGWPLGSQWMNPDAPGGGLITSADTGIAGTSTYSLAVTTTESAIPSAKKAVITAPPDTGGVAIVTFSYSLNLFSGNSSSVYIKLSGPSGLIAWQQIGGSLVATLPFTLRGSVQLAPGQEVTVIPVYSYSGTTAPTPYTIFRMQTYVEFFPGAVLSGGSAEPSTRYWDGDSWRPSMLNGAVIDVTKDAATAPPAKTNTTTTLARSASTIHAGSTLTLTSTTTSGAAGTVTFYRATSASGPWTSLGSATISATKAVKTWATTAGNWYFKATYGGSATHNGSTSAVTAVTTVQKLVTRTVVLACSWAQAYEGDGSKLSGTSHDTAVAQGYYSSSAGGNTKSLLRFVHSAIPSTADVTSVVLVCKSGGWDHWYNSSGGTLVVGSFNNQSSLPSSWPSSEVYEDRSRHSVDTGGWSVSLSSWATASLENNDFSGIAIGPGPSTSRSYYGYSATPAKDQFTLKVTYNNWE